MWNVYGPAFRATSKSAFRREGSSTTDTVLDIRWVLSFALRTYQDFQTFENRWGRTIKSCEAGQLTYEL
jgi:hypothetical protein